MGCPDAVCAEIKGIAGVTRVEFDQESQIFLVEFHKRFVNTDNIFAAVWQAGKKMGKEYLPQVVG